MGINFMNIFFYIRSRSVLDDVDASSVLLSSKFGRRVRLGILTTAVISYPLVSLLLNGPFIRWSFPYLENVDTELSERFDKIITEEYERYLNNEGRGRNSVIAKFYRSRTSDVNDSIVKGTTSLKTGVSIAFPFYVNMNSRQDAIDYCKERLRTFLFCGRAVDINWDSDVGQGIADTLYLSNNALRFLVLRDLYANEEYRSFVSKEITWTGYASVASFFTYVFHNYSKYRHSLQWFLFILLVTLTLAYFGAKYWYGLYRHLADLKADKKAGSTSYSHLEGGKEYYWKMLKRNRLLSSISEDVRKKVTPTGEMKSIITPLFKRYLRLKGIELDDDELKPNAEDSFEDTDDEL